MKSEADWFLLLGGYSVVTYDESDLIIELNGVTVKLKGDCIQLVTAVANSSGQFHRCPAFLFKLFSK